LPSLLIAGCGFLGEAAAGFFCAEGWTVAGLTASAESATRLSGRPYTVTAADISSPGSLAAVRDRHGAFDIVLHCASSGRGGADAYRKVYVDGVKCLTENFPEARLIFTSSTSVYAQPSGEWVDEACATEPPRETGRLLLEAEAIVRAARGSVLRLAGIYGPGRSVLLRRFLENSAVLENGGRRWINQIHRDDAVRAIQSVARSGAAGATYNVVDDQPATQREVYEWIAKFLGRPLPPEGPADPHRKRGWTSKRVRNVRLRELGWTPQFPSYCAALPSVAASLGATPAGASEG
jgi:nucleoside-diphosphate-sugar epimerase